MAMQQNLPSLISLISELIALPSISCVDEQIDQSNQAVVETLATWCESLGFHCEIQTVDLKKKKYNLIATLGTGDNGLVLSGHTDTVPYDAAYWHHNPFRLTETDNRLYGLGTADMKAFFAFALHAASQFDKKDLKHPLILLATCDEETGMAGAKALLTKTPRPRARHAIIGEPTSLKPIRMHKGIFMESIRIIGQSGHSSNPNLGHNALEAMNQVISTLLQWRGELEKTYQHQAFIIPTPTLNFGHIHGGDNPNRICGECELHIDFRPLPDMPLTILRYTLHERVRHCLADTAFKVEFTSLFDGIPAMETPAEAEIVRCVERLTNYEAGSVAFGTEAPYLQELGMQPVILGPGSIDQAHQPDEFIDLSCMQPTVELLTQIIHYFCVAKQ